MWPTGGYPKYNATPQWVQVEQPRSETFVTYSKSGGT